MLKDIQAAVTDHTTLQQHLGKKEWIPAVPVLLRLANKYARDLSCICDACIHVSIIWPRNMPLSWDLHPDLMLVHTMLCFATLSTST